MQILECLCVSVNLVENLEIQSGGEGQDKQLACSM